jgi:hypothetical protein
MRIMPVGFVEDVILTRRYVEAYYANEANVPGWETSELRTLAHHIEMEFAQEQIESNG